MPLVRASRFKFHRPACEQFRIELLRASETIQLFARVCCESLLFALAHLNRDPVFQCLPRREQVLVQLVERRLGLFDQTSQHERSLTGTKLFETLGDLAMLHFRIDSHLPVAATERKACQRVVVALRDRVELVIVTPRTRDGETKERL